MITQTQPTTPNERIAHWRQVHDEADSHDFNDQHYVAMGRLYEIERRIREREVVNLEDLAAKIIVAVVDRDEPMLERILADAEEILKKAAH